MEHEMGNLPGAFTYFDLESNALATRPHAPYCCSWRPFFSFLIGIFWLIFNKSIMKWLDNIKQPMNMYIQLHYWEFGSGCSHYSKQYELLSTDNNNCIKLHTYGTLLHTVAYWVWLFRGRCAIYINPIHCVNLLTSLECYLTQTYTWLLCLYIMLYSRAFSNTISN